ncbi:MAG: hypothetical protein AB1424_04955 [Thermodesulfobacteriota bacterium]
MGIKASVQIYSTMHKAYGLMNKVISEAAQSGYQIYKWCVFDFMEKCVGRNCEVCDLWEDCEGWSRNAEVFYPIKDPISAKRKVSRETWEWEMLCRMPSQGRLIYKEFDLSIHVVYPLRNVSLNRISTTLFLLAWCVWRAGPSFFLSLS